MSHGSFEREGMSCIGISSMSAPVSTSGTIS